MQDYNSFSSQSVEELKALQDKMHALYAIDNYENWYYDQATGLLTLSSGDNEINFRYFEVGTFSTSKKTWMWSWHNSSTLENVKEQCRQVKMFGLEAGFEKLTEGYFESDEIDAWEFAAIALKVTGGLGVYRPVSDDLLVFIVLLEVIDNATAEAIKYKYVTCATHGSGRTSFVCQHILSKDKVGFEEAFETYENMELDDDDDFQAWCAQCEDVRQQEDGWNDTSMSFASIKIVCEACYFNFKEINLGYR